MKHVIEAFDKTSESLVFEIPVPAEKFESLKTIMGWSSIEDAYYGYDLDHSQIPQLESLIGKDFFDARYDFQLGCYD